MDIVPSGYPELDAASLMMRTDPQKALEMCNEFALQNSENDKLHLTRIQANNRLGNWDQTMVSANDYIRLSPTHPQPYWKRAEAAHRLGLYQQSIADTKQSIKLDKDKYLGSLPYRLMALNHAQLGNLTEAMANAEKADQLETDEWFPPLGCIPSGTMPEFKAYLLQVANHAK